MIIQNIVDDFYRKLVPGKSVLILSGLGAFFYLFFVDIPKLSSFPENDKTTSIKTLIRCARSDHW